jgi:mannose/fructose/N-acetylgalactosamine-specific phosphotransferase system component IIC
MTFRGAIGAFLLGFVMFVAAIVSFGVNAPTVVGALFLVAMVACGVVGLVLAARGSSRLKASARAAQQQAQQQPAQQREPWDD